ncbi:periplasmic nitrate reductase, NapE protein [Denitromonas sp.]|uniref:periplasmic nitrate reductase, NapE protein n=1 Tax=Denitromonas sp. TaxID=2734609 RepID=UPI003A84A973
MDTNPPQPETSSFSEEAKVFLLITAVAIPVLSVVSIIGYGFAVWMLQLVFGPPGQM